MARKRWFTLIEIILVVLISSSIIVIMYRLLETLPKVKNFNDARQTLIQQTNDAMDRLAIIFQDYTVDYEEYYNRKAVGCTLDKGHCTEDTHYWNGNTNHTLLTSTNWSSWSPYSYGQYKRTFWSYWEDTDNDGNIVGDADDRDYGNWQEAISNPTSIKELYLISHDWSRRIFLRRYLHEYTWSDKTNFWTGYYWIQMLKLRGFDAWSKHQFDAASDSWVFDGQIDTWACDHGQMFECTWNALKTATSSTELYPWYKLPGSKDDWWVDLFDEKLNITDWNIEIYPVKDPDLAWAEMNQQINPYIKISLTAWLSEHLSSNRNWWGSWWFEYTLETVFDTKGFYIK